MNSSAGSLFCSCPRGLEQVLAEELFEIGAGDAAPLAGGVRCRGSWSDCYRINLHSRIASRVLWQIAKKRYRDEEDVYRLALAQDWLAWFDAAQTIRVDVVASKSKVQSIEFVTLRVKDAICDRFRSATGERPSVDTHNPDVRVFAYLDANDCTLYLDTSGEALFKRGWRQEAGEAPLRENLAAGILRLAGWKPGVTLLDPMCGSGTFVVEAAQICFGIAAGSKRAFGFEKLKGFDATVWREIKKIDEEKDTAAIAARGPLDLHASDVSGDAIAATRANLERAGIDSESALAIAPKQIDAREIKAPAGGGVMVINPPYGERMGLRGSASPEDFFAEFGNTLKQRFPGWTCNILSSDMALQKKLRLAPEKRIPLFNGAIECRLYRFEMKSGSFRT